MEGKKFFMLLKVEYFSKENQGKGLKCILDLVASGPVAPVAKVSDRKHFKISALKQILQRLPISLAEVKARNEFENLQMKSEKLYILCIKKKRLPKKYITI